MLHTLLTFLPVAIVLALTPGPATALVVRSALRGGPREALLTVVGNSVGILLWASAAAVGVAALVAASAIAFTALKLVGGAYLAWLGVQSFRRARWGEPVEAAAGEAPIRRPVRTGLLTSLANPKLAVFFVALLPQFVPEDAPILPRALAMALLLICLDLVWLNLLAALVSRAKDAVLAGPWPARAERLTGTVLIALGLRLATARAT